STRDVEVELRRLLATLLALSQSAPPALHAAGERGATGDLAALESELLAALIPLNHAAAGRALARLYRETLRAPRAATGDEASPVPSSVASPVPSSVASSQRAPSPAAPVVRTPLPGMAASQRAPSPVVPAVRTLAELEIDVDLDVDVSAAAATPPTPTPTPPQPASQVFEPVARPFEEEYSPTFAAASALPPDEELEPSAQRSDLRELLNGFLAHTRCEERMAADLRRMIGLGPGRGTSGHGSPLGR
ncbi:MAG TPA: hypothetical protein VJU61_08245, partial [Polyangiaceae bacterium]|nr:hypothetical protein [Polyangiaceae bacterium]